MFWYFVAPLTENKWSILFETQCRPFIYDSRNEALNAADKAAAKNYQKHGVPSGVRVKDNGGWADEISYGEE